MRLDPNHLDIESFPIVDPGTDEIMASQAPCAGTTSPCLNSAQTCGPQCMAVIPGGAASEQT